MYDYLYKQFKIMFFNMTKTLIFPVNNKGGVGKTSILTDLISVLSKNYNTGVIDFDRQGTLMGTLMKDHSVGSKPLEFYDSFETKDVVLQEAVTFDFADAMRTLKFNVNPSKTKASIFPVGMIYNDSSRKEKLEQIVNDFGDVDIIGVDLPPIPDANLILDYSIKPLVELFGDVKLVPLVVTTSDKNTIEIGLNQYPEINNYLNSLGVENKDISPVLLINKLRADYCSKHYRDGFRPEDIDKLGGLGLINPEFFEYKGRRPLIMVGLERRGVRGIITDSYEADGLNYFVSWLPDFSNCRLSSCHSDDVFGFYFGTKPELFQFPEINDFVLKQGFKEREHTDDDSITYIRKMLSLVEHVSSGVGSERYELFTLDEVVKDVSEVRSRLCSDIWEVVNKIYDSWENNPSCEYESISINEVKGAHWGPNSSGGRFDFEIPRQALSYEILTDTFYDTQVEIATSLGQTPYNSFDDICENFETGCSLGTYVDRSASAYNIGVSAYDNEANADWKFRIEIKDWRGDNSKESASLYKERFEIFMRNLNSAIVKYSWD